MSLINLRRALAATAILAASLAPISAQADDITIGQTFLASGLDPAEGSNGWALVSHGIGEQLFRVSREGEVVPNLARSATASEDGTWTIELAANRFFSDGTPVTAEAVAEALNRTGENNPSARATAGRLVFTALDEATLTVETE
ncbi:MAG: ABC transporter substrate-binding protein, partial [Pseudomonadota bacterium]